MTKDFKKYKVLSFINLGSAVVFSLLNINFQKDFAMLTFPLALFYTLVTAYFVIKHIIINTDGTKVLAAIKFSEYLPYVLLISFIIRRAGSKGTPYAIDVVQVLTWFVVFVLSYLSPKMLYPKNNVEVIKGWKTPPVEKKHKGMSRILVELVEWIDAFFWSIFTVLIFQIFFMQLYEIPSESMVPTFLIKDRVFVSKIDCGPKFPLTNVGLPDFRKYKRGDTIVLRNPHYNIDRKSEVKSVTNQLIHMLSLTIVNLNYDENGEMIADPLVKRITGLPGEQLVMQDGTLYHRTTASDVFEPVETDNKYAAWNLNLINKKLKPYVRQFPLSPADYSKMLAFEEQRRGYDLSVAEFKARDIVKQFNSLAFKNNLSGHFEQKSRFEYDLFKNIEEITRNLMCQEGGVQWFEEFMTSWLPAKNNIRDYYSESNFKLNVMSKIVFGSLVVKYAQLYQNGVSASVWNADEELVSLQNDAQTIYWYVQMLLDQRNMPVFPANDKAGNPRYIPSDCYFMMGDNRFNSLDLRHRYEQKETALTEQDPLSVTYYSLMEPQYIHKKYIIGKPILRFWPLRRFGKV